MGAAFKLETFSIASDRDVAAKPSVPAAEVETLLAKARGAARAQGFEEGAAAAAAAYDSERKMLLERMAEAVEDARFNAEDARRSAIAGLGPVIEALAEAIAPALARAGLGPQIAALVADAARVCDPASIEVRVAPDMAAAAAEALDAAGVGAGVKPDPALGPLEARAAWDSGYDQIDLANCIARAQDLIATFFNDDKRTGTDG